MSITRAPTDVGALESGSWLDDPAGTGTPAVGIADVPDTGYGFIDGLLTSVKWAGAISYGFPDSTLDYQVGYPGHELKGFSSMNAAQVAATQKILDVLDWNNAGPGHAGFSVEGLTDLEIYYAGAGHGLATIRLGNNTDVEENPAAYAGYPGTGLDRGDVWFVGGGKQPVVGNYDYALMMHEIGHAIGLKHGHEVLGPRPPLPVEVDAMEYTVMTYRSYFGGPTAGGYTNEKWGFAQSFMMLDIVALQYMYGADFTTNAGDTVYTWSRTTGATYLDGDLAIAPGGNRIFQTIWDGGGFDTYDLSNYATNLKIDLRPGYHSIFSTAQLARLGGDHHAGGNVYNALQYNRDPRSLIENATGGSGNDRIVGNDGGNLVYGNDGNDRLAGLGGKDVLVGGDGNDRLSGGADSDVMGGGDGNDIYRVDDPNDLIAEVAARAGGVDTVLAGVDYRLADGVENLRITGGASVKAYGNAAANQIGGNDANNFLLGLAGNDTLRGYRGNDVLYGGDGRDRLIGGKGADVLVGGRGADVFDFNTVGESPRGAYDICGAGGGARAFQGAGATGGDLIDLSGIDANTARGGNQTFVFGGAGIGHVSVVKSGPDTLVHCNTDNDAAFEFELVIEDGAVLASTYEAIDFYL